MQSIKNIFEKEKQYLQKEHEALLQSLGNIYENLQGYYQEAYSSLGCGKYYVNQTFIKQAVQALQNFNRILKANGSNMQKNFNDLSLDNKQIDSKNYKKHNFKIQAESIKQNPYLIDISLKQDEPQNYLQFTNPIDISSFVSQNRENSHISLTKKMIVQNNPTKISNYCLHLTSLQLKSHPYKQDLMINDIDLEKIVLFSNLTALNISQSLVTDKGLSLALQNLAKLKELNISNCCLLTDQTIKRLTGDRFVNLKLNSLNSISQEAVFSLIVHSYNLNYLEIKGSRYVQADKIFIQLAKIYAQNQANFKWLKFSSDIGIDLFINKLAYLTHLTSAQPITDQEVAVLLGDSKSNISGIFFTCCQELNDKTVKLICSQIENLKRLKLSKFIKLNDIHVFQIVRNFPDLQFLNLQECFSLTNNSLKFISQNCKKIKNLNLSWCRAITDQGIKIFCESQNMSLQCIDLSNLKFVSDEGIKFIALNCSELKSLIIEKCDLVTDKAINQISEHLPLLEQLVANYCQNLTDSSLSLVATRLRNLTRLEIQWCQVTQKCVQYIAENLKNLKTLNLNYCPSICDHQILLIADNPNSVIQILKLQSCDKVSENAFLKLSQSLKKLKHLDLRQCVGVTDQVMKSFCASSQSQIKFIDLSWCIKISDKTLFSISQYQHQLSHLNFSGCSQITDIGIQWIITTLKSLQFLNLSLCEKITDKSVCMISQLKKLRKIYLCELKRISDVSISNLSDLTGLEELHISGCQQVSSSSLLAILHNLQKLSNLNINDCSKIRPEFLSIMLDKIKNIRKLELSSLDIDDAFLNNLGLNLHKLVYINLSMCGKITDEGLICLVEKIPSLLKVDFQNTAITNRMRQKIVHTLNSRRLYNVTLD